MASGLATRCPACGTVFRVVLDQLRVSEGWVRCGRCGDVFNAAEMLLDLESGAARPVVLDRPAGGPSPAPVVPMQDTVAPEDDAPPVIEDAEHLVDERLPEAPHEFRSDTPPTGTATDPSPMLDSPPAAASEEPAAPPPKDKRRHSDPPATPSFLRRAEREQRWRQPRMRAALWATTALSVLGLVGQVVHAYRDLIAAQLPAARGALTASCEALGCRIEPPRVIESISVESSGLVRVEKSSLYRLAVALRNRAAFEVAVPAVELAVTDGQGKLLARRVLRPAEMGVSQNKLDAGRDLILQATLQLATEPLAGYTIELFYP